MGERGPAPKRDAQRRRRNKRPDAARGVADGINRAPKLTERTKHTAIAVRFWDRLGRSAQAVYFQESDWAFAELVVLAIDEAKRNPKASNIRAAMDGMSRLLVTEADRRRVRMELETAQGEDPEEVAADARILKLVDEYGFDDDNVESG